MPGLGPVETMICYPVGIGSAHFHFATGNTTGSTTGSTPLLLQCFILHRLCHLCDHNVNIWAMENSASHMPRDV